MLKKLSPGPRPCGDGCTYTGKSKLEVLMGRDFFKEITDKVVIDFGCGEGTEAVEMARHGAKRVIGIDIREDVLRIARQRAEAAKVEDRCAFSQSAAEPADVILSLDSFEHFHDPAAVLQTMGSLLRPSGEVFACFGPTWYHPLGGHLFSIFPWAHLLFSEEALMAWRSTFKTDGATRFSEVAGGLNQMTIKRFARLVAASPFRFASFDLVPIRRLGLLHNRFTREFTTAVVRCRLVKR